MGYNNDKEGLMTNHEVTVAPTGDLEVGEMFLHSDPTARRV